MTDLRELFWTCHACKQWRPDAMIAVWKESVPLGPATGEVRIRYCVDEPFCVLVAEHLAVGFAHRLRMSWQGDE